MSDSVSVSLAITSILVSSASSRTVAVSATATGASFTAVTDIVRVPVVSVKDPSETV